MSQPPLAAASSVRAGRAWEAGPGSMPARKKATSKNAPSRVAPVRPALPAEETSVKKAAAGKGSRPNPAAASPAETKPKKKKAKKSRKENSAASEQHPALARTLHPHRPSSSGAAHSPLGGTAGLSDHHAENMIGLGQDGPRRQHVDRKGRQRIGPRKKRLSTLKKKVLQERLRIWRETNGIAAGIAAQGEQRKASDPIGGGAVGDPCVCLEHFVNREELEDEDEYEEIVSDLTNLAKKVGDVSDVYLPRDNDDSASSLEAQGLAFVKFVHNRDAAAAIACWEGLTIGGVKVKATPVAQDFEGDWKSAMLRHDLSQAEKLKSADAAIADTNEETIVVIDNILTEDDFEDSDCLEETKEDLKALAAQFGPVSDIVPRLQGNDKGQVHIMYQLCKKAAEHAAESFNGMVIGGQSISAKTLARGKEANASADGAIVVLTNILSEDDFEDDDCLEESMEDILTMCTQFGEVKTIKAELKGEAKGQVRVVFIGGREVSEEAINAINGKIVGGDKVQAKLQIATVLNGTQAAESDATPDAKPKPMYSGEKLIPERYAECKRVPKVPSAPREYATKLDDDTVVPLIGEMLGELMRLQLRSRGDKNARARRRLVMGLREVSRGIRAHKVNMVCMANNLDEYGAIDEKLQEIIDRAHAEDVPIFFDLSKRRLGKAIGKSIKVAVIGIQNADGAYQPFKKLQKLHRTAARVAPDPS